MGSPGLRPSGNRTGAQRACLGRTGHVCAVRQARPGFGGEQSRAVGLHQNAADGAPRGGCASQGPQHDQDWPAPLGAPSPSLIARARWRRGNSGALGGPNRRVIRPAQRETVSQIGDSGSLRFAGRLKQEFPPTSETHLPPAPALRAHAVNRCPSARSAHRANRIFPRRGSSR